MLEELLDHVIAKDIGHELKGVRQKLSEELVLFVTVRSFKLLLNKPRSMLVAAEFDDMIVYILCR